MSESKYKSLSFQSINRLAIPAIISGIAEPLLSITDTAIIGNLSVNATESLAAVGIAGSFISAIVWILAQTRSAISAIVARYFGAENLQSIEFLPSQIIFINILLSLIIYVVTVGFASEIFHLYQAQGLIHEFSVSYYKIRAMGIPLTLFVFSVFGVFRGLQNTYWPMVISIVGALLNVGLDFLLVFGFKDIIPAMGIEGAAYASLLAQLVMAVMSVYLLLTKTPFKFSFNFNFHPEIKRILSLSFNLIIRALSLNFALYLANAYATGYGNAHIAAQTIAFQIWLFFAFFIDGYASVGNIMSGKFLGQEKPETITVLSRTLVKFTIFITLIIGAFCFIFYKNIGLIFSKEADVLTLFYEIFWLVILMQPINAIAFVFDGIFKGMAEAVTLRNTLLIATFIGFTPTLFLADYFGLELYGIWIAFWVWMLLRGGILIVIYNRKYLNFSKIIS
ncbi:MATE family efflux transporter [Namhaeicola litoreus]|uniref:Multidrug-efflux transporter n=1 Tax=Namhaeicola litoreus TaxID=1052145 RepID=A0ABW3Y0L3_9FLAO